MPGGTSHRHAAYRRVLAERSTLSIPTTHAIRAIALDQRGDQYVPGGIGPSKFDCSGLVRYAYGKALASSRLGGGHSALGMYMWARRNHLTSRTNPRIGDVVVYGRGSHVGIYIGKGRVLHALNRRRDIVITSVHGLTTPFTTFIHTRIGHG